GNSDEGICARKYDRSSVDGGRATVHMPPRILVVDDTPENLEIIAMRLQHHSYDIVTAVDGEDALEKVRASNPDLILLDIMMPKLDGIAVTQRLKAVTSLSFIPIILLTA